MRLHPASHRPSSVKHTLLCSSMMSAGCWAAAGVADLAKLEPGPLVCSRFAHTYTSTGCMQAPAEALEGPAGQREGPAGQWRTKKWFKAVLFAAENQGPRCKTAAANEAEVRCNTDGTAAKYLEEVDYYRHRGWVMAPERHLAWYLNMLRNALGHAESADMTLSPVQASASAFALLLDSPVVQPTATIPKRFNAIRHAKLP